MVIFSTIDTRCYPVTRYFMGLSTISDAYESFYLTRLFFGAIFVTFKTLPGFRIALSKMIASPPYCSFSREYAWVKYYYEYVSRNSSFLNSLHHIMQLHYLLVLQNVDNFFISVTGLFLYSLFFFILFNEASSVVVTSVVSSYLIETTNEQLLFLILNYYQQPTISQVRYLLGCFT